MRDDSKAIEDDGAKKLDLRYELVVKKSSMNGMFSLIVGTFWFCLDQNRTVNILKYEIKSILIESFWFYD